VRGCLSVLVLGAVFLGALVWFGGPPVASAVVTSALRGSGLAANQLDVEVTADPPLILVEGRADRVTIHATGASWKGVAIASLELTLDSVDLLARSAASANGRLGSVQLDAQDRQPVLGDVELTGSTSAAKTTIQLDAAGLEPIAATAFVTEFGIRPSSVTLVTPDIIRVTLGPRLVDATLKVDADGSVVAVANGASIVLFTPNPALPIHLTGLTASLTRLTLHGTFDVGKLLR